MNLWLLGFRIRNWGKFEFFGCWVILRFLGVGILVNLGFLRVEDMVGYNF